MWSGVGGYLGFTLGPNKKKSIHVKNVFLTRQNRIFPILWASAHWNVQSLLLAQIEFLLDNLFGLVAIKRHRLRKTISLDHLFGSKGGFHAYTHAYNREWPGSPPQISTGPCLAKLYSNFNYFALRLLICKHCTLKTCHKQSTWLW